MTRHQSRYLIGRHAAADPHAQGGLSSLGLKIRYVNHVLSGFELLETARDPQITEKMTCQIKF